jgi:hypothetical protein
MIRLADVQFAIIRDRWIVTERIRAQSRISHSYAHKPRRREICRFCIFNFARYFLGGGEGEFIREWPFIIKDLSFFIVLVDVQK